MTKQHKNPFRTCAGRRVDPAYAAARRFPDPAGAALFSSPPAAGKAGWCHLFGDLALHLFHRTRDEAYEVCQNIFHPGEFPACRPTLHARRTVRLRRPEKSCKLTLYCSGVIVLGVNGQTCFRRSFPSRPEACVVEIGPFLRSGENELRLTIQRREGPAAFLIPDTAFRTGTGWQLSSDSVRWEEPEIVAAGDLSRFPHQEELPEISLAARRLENGAYDFGVEVFGRPQIIAEGAGRIGLAIGESLPEADSTDPRVREQQIPPLRKNGNVYECPVNLALRYVRLNCPATLRVQEVRLQAPFYPARYAGTFACSDPALTAVWQHSAYTMRLCMRLLCVDGLKRDRLPWGGDLYLAGLVNGCSFFEKELMRRSLYALYGAGPETAEVSGIVDYSLLWILAVRDHWLTYDDGEFVQRLASRLERLLSALQRRENAEGFLPTRPGDWVFVDWSPVEKDGCCACVQMLYIMALAAAAELQTALENADAAHRLRKRAGRLREQCRTVFWSETAGAYVDNAKAGKTGAALSRPTNIFAILCGAAGKAQQRKIVKNVLGNPQAVAVGTPYMRTFEAQALAACGETAQMLELIRTDWGGMLAAGATTFWEGYNAAEAGAGQYAFYGRPFAKSLCHAWSAGPVYLLSRTLSGLTPLSAGWRRFTIHTGTAEKAGMPEWFSVALPCPSGTIRLTREGGKTALEIPRGTVFVHPATGRESAGPCTVRYEFSPVERLKRI